MKVFAAKLFAAYGPVMKVFALDGSGLGRGLQCSLGLVDGVVMRLQHGW